ncbi:MAG TPA: excinuclease ABC subunit UvrA [Bacteroidales bacterium]|nr:excinuclease ABC subunit UvrA [Bacteroidales bacterium]
MDTSKIIVQNAHTNNLKNVSLEIPKHQVVVFTGVSGSGKSSLVFDTIFTEAQRQLIETFSSFARRRLPKLSRPDVDEIRNISTAIVIDQKRMGRNLRSTVGTATEIATYLRLLFSRCGEPFIGPSFFFSYNHPEGMCPVCKGLGKKITVDVDLLLDRSKSLREGAITHPDIKVGSWYWREIMVMNLFDVDKPIEQYTPEELDKLLYAESIPIIKPHGAGTYTKNFEGLVRKFERLYLNKSEDEMPEAKKDAYAKYFVYSHCDACNGSRINERARSVKLSGYSYDELSDIELSALDEYLASVHHELARSMVSKMRQILGHLIEIGVGYLSLNRPVSTLSGGESQRVKMARQLDCDLVDMMYILDEPSIGLHAKDNAKLIEMLRKLRDKGNSVLVVEHDPDIIRASDWLIDVGPKAGREGGHILYEGNIEGVLTSGTLTGDYLAKPLKGTFKRKSWTESIAITNASAHNLKNVSVSIPKGVFTCVTGVAGSGKSSLIHEVFVKQHQEAVVIDQSPVGKNSRSIPVMYIGVFDLMRKEIAKAVNADAALFSFNSKGACEKCNGTGHLSFEMSFMDDVKIVCDECDGQKYKDDVLKLKYKGKNIFEILSMTVAEAEGFFDDKEINRRLRVLNEVGLDYLQVGQSMSSLSGGEAQRIKLASELHKKGNIYVMDEPTTGLHMADTDKLLAIIKRLVDNKNTVIVIEHNLDVIKHADWVIDMGPLGGKMGGEVLVSGTPEDVVKCEASYTGMYLRELL